ncbi:MAG: hypothetical protein ACW98Y_09645 [Candidatus Thorarchaeota archaeon]|jgi:hypothetical protein
MYDEDEMFEDIDEEEEDTFPDEADYDEGEADNYPERTYAEPEERLESFLDDPWPRMAFILIVIGLGLVILTPNAIWSTWYLYLITTYGLIVLAGVASIISIGVYRNAEGSRLRWGGITNLLVVLISGAVGVADAVSIVTTGSSILVGSSTPLLALCVVIILFSMYTLWLIQRTFTADAST